MLRNLHWKKGDPVQPRVFGDSVTDVIDEAAERARIEATAKKVQAALRSHANHLMAIPCEDPLMATIILGIVKAATERADKLLAEVQNDNRYPR